MKSFISWFWRFNFFVSPSWTSSSKNAINKLGQYWVSRLQIFWLQFTLPPHFLYSETWVAFACSLPLELDFCCIAIIQDSNMRNCTTTASDALESIRIKYLRFSHDSNASWNLSQINRDMHIWKRNSMQCQFPMQIAMHCFSVNFQRSDNCLSNLTGPVEAFTTWKDSNGRHWMSKDLWFAQTFKHSQFEWQLKSFIGIYWRRCSEASKKLWINNAISMALNVQSERAQMNATKMEKPTNIEQMSAKNWQRSMARLNETVIVLSISIPTYYCVYSMASGKVSSPEFPVIAFK